MIHRFLDTFLNAWHAFLSLPAYERFLACSTVVVMGAMHYGITRFLKARDRVILEFAWNSVKFVGRVIRGKAAEASHGPETR